MKYILFYYSGLLSDTKNKNNKLKDVHVDTGGLILTCQLLGEHYSREEPYLCSPHLYHSDNIPDKTIKELDQLLCGDFLYKGHIRNVYDTWLKLWNTIMFGL